jgi:hypothetical protein
MVTYAYNPSYWEAEVGRLWSKVALGKSVRPYLKNKLKPTVLGLWLKGLPSKCEVLSSNPSTTKKYIYS